MNNFGKQLSTGNTGRDVLLSGLIGYANNLNPKGTYYVTSNWNGNGLASSGIGYLQNARYTNPYDLANVISGMFDNKSNYKQSGYNLGNNILSKLSGIGSKVGNWASNKWGSIANGKYNNVGDFYNNLGGMA